MQAIKNGMHILLSVMARRLHASYASRQECIWKGLISLIVFCIYQHSKRGPIWPAEVVCPPVLLLYGDTNDSASQIRSSTSSSPPSSGPPLIASLVHSWCTAYYISALPIASASVMPSLHKVMPAFVPPHMVMPVLPFVTACLIIAAALRTASTLCASCKLTSQEASTLAAQYRHVRYRLCLSGATWTSVYTRSQAAAHGSHRSSFTGSNRSSSQKHAYAPAAHARIIIFAYRNCSQFSH